MGQLCLCRRGLSRGGVVCMCGKGDVGMEG